MKTNWPVREILVKQLQSIDCCLEKDICVCMQIYPVIGLSASEDNETCIQRKSYSMYEEPQDK